MKFLTGDDNGLLKCTEISLKEGPKQLFKYGLQKEDHEIHNLTWSLPTNSDYCTFTHSSGIVKTFDMQTEKVLFKKQLEKDKKGVIRGIALIGDDIMNQKLLFAESTGTVSTIQLDVEDIEEQEQEQLLKIKKRSDDKKLTTLTHRMNSQYLFLGQFLPQIYDIENAKCTWRAKNVSNDEDDLEIPMFDTSGQFLPGSTREFVISNGYGKLRLYDVCANVKPVIDYQACDYLLSKAVPTECGKYIIYASQKGDLIK
jgi:hypothetical protein